MTTARFIPTPATFGWVDSGAFSGVVGLPQGCIARVLGAPGSGKTSALVTRFVSLVKDHGLLPQEILVLSATRESAASLRDRLVLALANGSEYAVEGSLARTAASVAFAIVRHHAISSNTDAPAVRLPELISGAEQDAIFSQLLAGPAGRAAADLWPAHVPEVTRGLAGFRAELRDLVAACQEMGLAAGQLATLDPARREWAAASKIFEGYEALMATPEYLNRFDSPSLINRAIQLLAAGENIPEFQAVLVDDAQELTPSATRLIQAIADAGVEIVLFGDPDVSTLGFRQADPGLMGRFASQLAASRGQAVTDVVLGQEGSLRSAEFSRVLGKVSSLIGAEGAGRQRKTHSSPAVAESQPDPTVKVFASKQAETEWLAYTLRKLHLEQGLPWQEMAIVARTRQQLDELERALSAESVPIRVSGAQTALRDEFAAREMLELAGLVCLNPPITADLAERLLRSPFCGLDSVGLRRLRRSLRRQEITGLTEGTLARNSDELLVELFEIPASAETLPGTDAYRVRGFLKSVSAATKLAANPEATIEDVLWSLWESSGLAKAWSETSRGIGEVATQANRNLDAIVALFAAANRFVERNPNGEKAQFVITQLEQAVPEDSLAFGRQADQFVQLLTPAGLVGRRFQLVAVPQLIEGVWPNLKPRNSLLNANLLVAQVSGRVTADGGAVRAEMADELRMFYKAIGASSGQVLISSYFDEDEQVSQFVGLASPSGIPAEEDFKLSSLTLRGMAGSLRRRLATSQNPVEQAKLAVDLGRLAQAGVPGAHPDDWYGLAQISSTEPLFEFVSDGNLQDLEETADRGERITINPSQLEAFAKCPLHWFLNYHGASSSDYSASIGTLVHRALELATSVDEAELWKTIDSSWHTLKFESAWIEQAERRRAQKMVANLSAYLSQFELSGGRVVAKEQAFEFNLGDAHIRGKVDRIERTADGSVMIVDLKTGSKVVSIADGEANPQLGLYQLAYQNGAYGELSSVEPDAKLEGAKLLLVSGSAPVLRAQQSLDAVPEQAAYFTNLVQAAAHGMAMPDNIFVARVSSHCDDDSQFGSCQLHLTKAVSYGD